jgi:hypothetical protein
LVSVLVIAQKKLIKIEIYLEKHNF